MKKIIKFFLHPLFAFMLCQLAIYYFIYIYGITPDFDSEQGALLCIGVFEGFGFFYLLEFISSLIFRSREKKEKAGE